MTATPKYGYYPDPNDTTRVSYDTYDFARRFAPYTDTPMNFDEEAKKIKAAPPPEPTGAGSTGGKDTLGASGDSRAGSVGGQGEISMAQRSRRMNQRLSEMDSEFRPGTSLLRRRR